MKEIEVKARVKDVDALLKQLEEMGCVFSPTIHQIDRIFIAENGTIPSQTGDNVLRIREQNGKYFLTLKQTQSNQLDCIEEEVEISDPEAMMRIFRLLGYHKSIGVKKKRRQAKYQDYTICLDEVEELGAYIEVEKFSDADGPTVQNELFQFLETLGIGKEDQETNGYDVILYNKNKS
jgi:adenylate cyclase, class 2